MIETAMPNLGPRLAVPSGLDNEFSPTSTANGEKQLWDTSLHVPSISVQNCEGSAFSESILTGSDPGSRSEQSFFSTIPQDIADQMRGSFQTSVPDDQDFLPYDMLCKILSLEVVSELLQAAFEDDDRTTNDLATSVLGHNYQPEHQRNPLRLKIFAILVMIDRIPLIHDFIRGGIMDEDLPLKVQRTRKGDVSKVILHLCRKSQILDPRNKEFKVKWIPLDLSPSWSFKDMEDFEARQKTICVPVFKLPCEEIQFYDFTKRPTLPFLTYDQPKVGGYGTVRKAEIHGAHYSHVESCKTKRKVCSDFAVKELHAGSEEAYEQEIQLFTKIGARQEKEPPKHLIQLQFSYLYGDRYFLVFPWASGNLREFWKQKHHYDAKKQEDMWWFFNQCKGLVAGLQNVHKSTTLDVSKLPPEVLMNNLQTGKIKRWGRHGDIKPENILWFEKYEDETDFLVISDFGLTRFNTTSSKSKVRPESIVGCSGTYRPPELDLRGEISPRYDVWSLGCVFLEFVSWLLLGDNETQDAFTTSRIEGDQDKYNGLKEDKFFVVEDPTEPNGERQPRIKPSVIDWIDKLRARENCTEELLRFLHYIQDHMLQPVLAKRHDCGQIMAELDEILGLSGSCKPTSGSDLQGGDGTRNPIADLIPRASSFPLTFFEASRAPSEATVSRRATAPAYSRKQSTASTSPTSISSDTDGVANGILNHPPSSLMSLPSQKQSLTEVGSRFTDISVQFGHERKEISPEALDLTEP